MKKQQKVLREQEWNAKPEYEKRKVVVSVDLVGGKVVRRMGTVESPRGEEDVEVVGGENYGNDAEGSSRGTGGGAFSKNPLMGSLIRPVWKGKGTAKGEEGEEDKENDQPRKNNTWRRVQDDDEDNEAWILDGGVYGGNDAERRLGDEEHAFG